MVLCGISWSAVFEQRYDRLYELLDKAHILRDDFARTVHLLNHRQLFLIGRPHSFGKYDFDRIGDRRTGRGLHPKPEPRK